MNAYSLIIYTFAAFGLAWGIGSSPLTRPIRTSFADAADQCPSTATAGLVTFCLDLVECPACFGFHIGWIAVVAAPVWSADLLPMFGTTLTRAFVLAFYTAGVNFLLGKHTGLID